MNLPNKLTILRIFMSILIMIILLFPFNLVGYNFPKLLVNGEIIVDVKYLLSGILFVLASFTDYLDGYIARKYNLVTDFGKMMDAIADKMLVNSVLIILSAHGFIHPSIPVIVILRDTVVNTIKMIVGNKGKAVAAISSGKIKTACLMIGITLTMFYNLPFELINLRVDLFLLVVATLLSIYSGIQYYVINKKVLF